MKDSNMGTLYRPAPFYLSALGLSWLPWSAAVVLGIDARSPFGIALVAAGGLGPVAAAAAMLASGGRKVRSDYLRRLPLLPVLPAAAAALMPAAVVGISVLISVLLGGKAPAVEPRILAGPASAALYALFILFFGPVPEELGWRGYGLPGLLARTSPAAAAAVSGSLWAIWHLPLFFIQGYPLAPVAEDPLRLAAYFLDFFPKALLYVRLYTASGGSILVAVIFHFSTNLVGSAVEAGTGAELIQTVLWYLAAALTARRREP